MVLDRPAAPAPGTPRRLRVLFVMRNHGYLRHFDSTLRALAARGHSVLVATRGGRERHIATDTDAYLAELQRECPLIEPLKLPQTSSEWTPLTRTARSLRDYLRYRHPRYRGAHKLAARARSKVPSSWRRRVDAWPWRGRAGAALLDLLLRTIERIALPDRRIDKVLRRLKPDLVVATPLVDFGSYQADWVKSARALGVPSVLAVASWDNLTNKGLIPVQPDLVLVWNEVQREEAVSLHRVRPERVVVTGAQLFDDWFQRRPATDRDAFCRRLGLDPARPTLLYLCSSLFIVPEEVSFVRSWLGALRGCADPRIARCNVLVRPYPGNAGQWRDVDLSALGPAAIHPREGALPIPAAEKSEYFDALYHSAAVVGLNTSGLLEAGIVGKRSFTILAPEFRDTQEGTLHFGYLHRSGFLVAARDLNEHFRQLGEQLAKGSTPAVVQDFVRDFLRPHGLDLPATPLVVESLEQAAAIRPLPDKGLWLRAARSWLAPRLESTSATPPTARKSARPASG